MAPTLPTDNNGNPQTPPNEEETPHLWSVHRRAPSFPSSWPSNSSSRSSSSFSFNEDYPPFSPSTPLKFKGVPFSWEHIPGIPKHQKDSKNKAPSSNLFLPLPPAGNSNSCVKKSIHVEEISPKKYSTVRSLQRDPFFAALVECSKDDDDNDHDQGSGNIWKGSKIARTLIHRAGFINAYASCKRSCAVSESMVYLPRSTPHYLLNRRSN